MDSINRTANVVWEGTIARGTGYVSGGSGALAALPVTAASRMGDPTGKTSPEELIAAAHATCFTMALGSILARDKTPPERLAVSAGARWLSATAYAITTSELDAVGRGRAWTRPHSNAVREAEQNCPVSRARRKRRDPYASRLEQMV
jgi:osmotically inducible protein OsmC